MIEAAIKALMAHGGPLAVGILIGLGIGLALWRIERKERQELSKSVLDLAVAQVDAQSKTTNLIDKLSSK